MTLSSMANYRDCFSRELFFSIKTLWQKIVFELNSEGTSRFADSLVVPNSGHAFEARIYAENVTKGFLPATGVLHHYRPLSGSSSSK